MPNKKGGKHYKKGKKGIPLRKELVIRESIEEEDYAFVTRKLGNGRFHLTCQDNRERMGIISGKMRKRVWINVQDCVLIAKWEFQDEKCNIIHKYDANEVDRLQTMGELDSTFVNQNRLDSGFEDTGYNPFDVSSSDEEDILTTETDEVNLDEI
jgi:translation initiation factor 1A